MTSEIARSNQSTKVKVQIADHEKCLLKYYDSEAQVRAAFIKVSAYMYIYLYILKYIS